MHASLNTIHRFKFFSYTRTSVLYYKICSYDMMRSMDSYKQGFVHTQKPHALTQHTSKVFNSSRDSSVIF